MSADVTGWVLRESSTKGTDRLVLLVLADAADHDGSNAWPSVETIGQRANVGRRAAQLSLRRLETAGHIRVESNLGGSADCRSDRRPNRYTVLMTGRTRVRPEPSTGAHESLNRGAYSDPTGRTTIRPTVLDQDLQSKDVHAASQRAPQDWGELDQVKDLVTTLADSSNGLGPALRDQLLDVELWRDVDRLTQGTQVFYDTELRKYVAWLMSKPATRRHKNLRRGFLSWVKEEIRRDSRRRTRSR